MAKINRYQGNLQAFASGATGQERVVFGQPSSAPTQSDDLTENINAAFTRGWGTVPLGDKPPREWFNSAAWVATQLSAYLHQVGVAEWNDEQEYHEGSYALIAGFLFVSQTDGNTGNNPRSDGTNWALVGHPLRSVLDLVGNDVALPEGTALRLDSYSGAGDAGGAQWVAKATTGLTASQNPSELESTEVVDGTGRLWGVDEAALVPEMFGAVSGQDSTGPLKALAAGHGGRKVVISGQYICNEGLVFLGDTTVEALEGSEIDFSGKTSGDAIVLGSENFDDLGPISSNVTRGDVVINMSAPPSGLSQGDRIIIRSAEDFSWQSSRDYYRKGEWATVYDVSGSQITVDAPLRDTYLTGESVTVIKPGLSKVKWSGLRILNDGTATETGSALTVKFGDAPDVKGVKTRGFSGLGVTLIACVNGLVKADSVDYAVDDGLNYAVSFYSTQNCWLVDSDMTTLRHPFTMTGGNTFVTIPNRDSGARNSKLKGSLLAADMHGACDNCGFVECDLYGAQLAGASPRLINCIVRSVYRSDDPAGEATGVVLRTREVCSADYDIRGNKFILEVPIPAGVSVSWQQAFLIGANQDKKTDGTIRFSDNTIEISGNVSECLVRFDLAGVSSAGDLQFEVSRNIVQSDDVPAYVFCDRGTAYYKSVKVCGNDWLTGRFDIDAETIDVEGNTNIKGSITSGLLFRLDQEGPTVLKIADNHAALNSDAGIGATCTSNVVDLTGKEAHLINNVSYDNEVNLSGSVRSSIGVVRMDVVFISNNSVGNKDTTNQVQAMRITDVNTLFKADTNLEPYSSLGLSTSNIGAISTTFL